MEETERSCLHTVKIVDAIPFVVAYDRFEFLEAQAFVAQGEMAGTAEQGSHTVMFIEAERVLVGEDGAGALVYFRRRFHAIPTSLTA